MKEDIDGQVFGSVTFTIDVPLKPWCDEPRRYVHSVEGTICVRRDTTEGDMEIAGKLKLVVIMCTEATNDYLALSKVFQSYSAELHDVYLALFDRHADFKAELAIEASCGEMLFVDEVVIEPAFQSGFLTVQAIETAIATFASTGVSVARRGTLPTWQFRQLGFRRVMATRFVFRDNACCLPHV
jgi:hypothetical protein